MLHEPTRTIPGPYKHVFRFLFQSLVVRKQIWNKHMAWVLHRLHFQHETRESTYSRLLCLLLILVNGKHKVHHVTFTVWRSPCGLHHVASTMFVHHHHLAFDSACGFGVRICAWGWGGFSGARPILFVVASPSDHLTHQTTQTTQTTHQTCCFFHCFLASSLNVQHVAPDHLQGMAWVAGHSLLLSARLDIKDAKRLRHEASSFIKINP